MKEKISVIVPLYNAENYLKRCIDSIINQTYQNLEIILINDGSTDNTLEIINEYAQKKDTIIVIDKKNSGVSDSRNLGIEKSTGEYITFIDSDDWLEENAIESLYEQLKKSNYNIIRGKYIREIENKKSQKAIEKFSYNIEDKEKNIQRLIDLILSGEMYCYVWLLMIKSNIIKNKVFFNNKLAMMEDTIFYLDLLLDGNDILFSDSITYHYYLNKKSASQNIQNAYRNYKNALLVNKIFEEKLKMKNIYSEKRKKIFYTKTSLSIASYIYTTFKYDRRNFKKCYENIINNQEICDILKYAELKNINKQNLYIIKFLKYKKYRLLRIFLNFRYFMAKIKNRLLKRDEVV